MTKTAEQKLDDFADQNGNWPLINGGVNDCVQSVIQCLVSNDKLVKEVLKGRYNNHKSTDKNSKLVSNIMNRVFSDMWRNDIGASRKVVDIGHATTALGKWFKPKAKHDAADMLRFVISKLIEESMSKKKFKAIFKAKDGPIRS